MAAVDFAAIADLLSPVLTASQTYGDALVPMGRTLLALSLVLAALPAVYGWWLGDVQGSIAKLLRAALICIIPLTLLCGSNWVNITGSLAQFYYRQPGSVLSKRSDAADRGERRRSERGWR